MTARPEIAVFGAGLVGRRHIDQAIAQAKLSAIVDPSEPAQALAQELNVGWFATPEACLSATRPDGVVIATPNHLHAEHAGLCIAAGLPCLIEKPIAETGAAAQRITDAAKAAGVPILVGHHRRHNPIIARAKAAIDAGRLGEIVAVSGQFWLYKPEDYFEAAWRKAPGAGPALINFVHDVDLLRYLCGDIVEVQAMRANAQRGQPVEDTAAVLLRFVNGALGSFSLSDTIVAPYSWEMTSGENPVYPHIDGACYAIGGTQATLSIPDLRVWSHAGARSWWNPISANQLEVAHADAFRLQFGHFLDVINGAAPLVTAQEGTRSLEVVLAVLSSALPACEPGTR